MRILWPLLAAAVLGGCGGRIGEPPKPEQALSADSVSLVDHWETGPCDHLIVTLRSGTVLDVSPFRSNYPEGCPQIPTTFLLGDSGELTYQGETGKPFGTEWNGPGSLVFMGTNDGQPWLGAVAASYGFSCWQFRFKKGDGAYLEEDTLHFTSGLVLPLADGFDPYFPSTPYDEPYPLRYEDAVCLNSEGEVEKVEVWAPY